MILDAIRRKIEGEITKPIRVLSTSTSISFFWEDVTFLVVHFKDTFSFTLTKKNPREAMYGLTTIDFTGMDEELAGTALEFLIERLKELV